MNLLVCVKQVPDTTEIKIDPETHRLIRKGVPSILNPFDAYAFEMAARIKDVHSDAKIIVLSMGPDQAKNALRECLAIGADNAYLLSDRAFGGSDTLATSYILSEGIKKVAELEGDFDVIFCGKQAIDGDTAQVGPEIAEHMDLPQITYGLEAEYKEDGLCVTRETDEGKEILEAEMPCLVTVTKPDFEPRFPTIKGKLAARKKEIVTLTSEDLSTIDLMQAGLKGSPTKVKSTFTPEIKAGGLMIEAETSEEAAEKLANMLESKNII